MTWSYQLLMLLHLVITQPDTWMIQIASKLLSCQWFIYSSCAKNKRVRCVYASILDNENAASLINIIWQSNVVASQKPSSESPAVCRIVDICCLCHDAAPVVDDRNNPLQVSSICLYHFLIFLHLSDDTLMEHSSTDLSCLLLNAQTFYNFYQHAFLHFSGILKGRINLNCSIVQYSIV